MILGYITRVRGRGRRGGGGVGSVCVCAWEGGGGGDLGVTVVRVCEPVFRNLHYSYD